MSFKETEHTTYILCKKENVKQNHMLYTGCTIQWSQIGFLISASFLHIHITSIFVSHNVKTWCLFAVKLHNMNISLNLIMFNDSICWTVALFQSILICSKLQTNHNPSFPPMLTYSQVTCAMGSKYAPRNMIEIASWYDAGPRKCLISNSPLPSVQ